MVFSLFFYGGLIALVGFIAYKSGWRPLNPRRKRRYISSTAVIRPVFQFVPVAAPILVSGQFAEEALRQAETSLREGDYLHASKLYSVALYFGPDASILTNRGMCYLQLGDAAKAVSDFRSALETSGAGRITALGYLLGYALVKTRRFNEALSQFDGALQADSRVFEGRLPRFLLSWLASLYRREASRRSAARLAETAKRLRASIEELTANIASSAGRPEVKIDAIEAIVKSQIEEAARTNAEERTRFANKLVSLRSISYRCGVLFVIATSIGVLVTTWKTYTPPQPLVPAPGSGPQADKDIYVNNESASSMLFSSLDDLTRRKETVFSLNALHAYRLRYPRNMIDWILAKRNSEALILVAATPPSSLMPSWPCHILVLRTDGKTVGMALGIGKFDTSPEGEYVELPNGLTNAPGKAIEALKARVAELVDSIHEWKDLRADKTTLFVPIVDRTEYRQLAEQWRQSNGVLRRLFSRIEELQDSSAPFRHNAVSLGARVFSIDQAGATARYNTREKIVQRSFQSDFDAGTLAHELTHALLHELPELERDLLLGNLSTELGIRHLDLVNNTLPLFYDTKSDSQSERLQIIEECAAFFVGSLAEKRDGVVLYILSTPYPTSTDEIRQLSEPLLTADVEDLAKSGLVPSCMAPGAAGYSDVQISGRFYTAVEDRCKP